MKEGKSLSNLREGSRKGRGVRIGENHFDRPEGRKEWGVRGVGLREGKGSEIFLSSEEERRRRIRSGRR